MIVHASLRLTHIELAKLVYQRLKVDMNHHAHPPKPQRRVLRLG